MVIVDLYITINVSLNEDLCWENLKSIASYELIKETIEKLTNISHLLLDSQIKTKWTMDDEGMGVIYFMYESYPDFSFLYM